MANMFANDNIFLEKGLSDRSYNDIMDLIKICNDFDKKESNQSGSILPSKNEPSDFLLYREDRLIGYLCIYPSSNGREMKINGMVHPSFRRRGIFSKLFQAAKKICIKENNKKIIIINEQTSINGELFVSSTGAKFKYSTYKMDFSKKFFLEEIDDNDGFEFKTALHEDMNDIVKIGMQGFGTTEDEELEYYKFNMETPNRNLYIAKLDDIVVGIITIVVHEKGAHLCDLAVHKNYRRKGFGRRILLKTINKLLSQGIDQIQLSVEVKNRNALSLYEYCGFRIVGGLDFYELHL